MPLIDYHLTADINLTKDALKQATSSLLAPDFNLGKDNRTWNKKQLDALKLLLCNVVAKGKQSKGVFLYSRKKQQIPTAFNPFDIGYSSLIKVIDMLGDAKILDNVIAVPRQRDVPAENKQSQFTVTKRTYDLAEALGFTRKATEVVSKSHVRLRDRMQRKHQLEFESDPYTQHIEELMADYSAYLNKFAIVLPSSGEYFDEEGEAVGKHYGSDTGGETIFLYRNFRNWNKPAVVKGQRDNFTKEFKKLRIKTKNPNMSFGGRSGQFWQGARKTDRPYTLMQTKTKTADIPACHINLCYYNELGKWYQMETKDELMKAGRIEQDAYYLPNVDRNITKQIVQLMLNVRGKSAVSRVFNDWLNNPDKCDAALAEAHKQTGITNVEIMTQLDKKHSIIGDYFYKGKLAGQIISWQEANMIHHLAWDFIQKIDVPVLSIYDELICPELQHQLLIDWWWYNSLKCEVCNDYSLMDQIKNL